MSEPNKFQISRETQLFIAVGFVFAVWMNAGVQMFLAYVIGITSRDVTAMIGNAREKNAEAVKESARLKADAVKHTATLKYGPTKQNENNPNTVAPVSDYHNPPF